ncbi:hypothetical protein MRB53_041836 [Persea americana]|nr:hypothetical protein MRB53_041836 [Persea americana]
MVPPSLLCSFFSRIGDRSRVMLQRSDVQCPGFDQPATLSPFDLTFPYAYIHWLHIFNISPDQSAEETLRLLERGIHGAVKEIPILATTADEQGVVTPATLPYFTQDLSEETDIESLRSVHYASSKLLPERYAAGLLTIGNTAPGSMPKQSCVIQATLIKGGLVLATATSHIFGDAKTCLLICDAIARNSFPEAQVRPVDPGRWDRSCLRFPLTSTQPTSAFMIHDNVRVTPSKPATKPSSMPEIKVCMLHIPVQAAAGLKQEASRGRQHGILRGGEDVELITSIDVRGRLPGLRKDYVGNAVFLICGSTPVDVALGPDGLTALALANRKAITDAEEHDQIRGALAHAQSVPGPRPDDVPVIHAVRQVVCNHHELAQINP